MFDDANAEGTISQTCFEIEVHCDLKDSDISVGAFITVLHC